MQLRARLTRDPSSRDTEPSIEVLTISAALSRTAGRFPRHTALDFHGARIAYRTLEALVHRFSRALKALGVREQARVAVCLPSLPQAVIAHLAILRLGAVTVPLSPQLSERELADALHASSARLLITLSLLVPTVRRVHGYAPLEHIVACHLHSFMPLARRFTFPLTRRSQYRRIEQSREVLSFEELLWSHPAEPCPDLSDWASPAALFFSRGTAGNPRGGLHTQATLSTGLQQLLAHSPGLLPGHHRLVGSLPLSQVEGFLLQQCLPVWQGWTQLHLARSDAPSLLEALESRHPTLVLASGPHLDWISLHPRLRTADLSSVKGFFVTGAPLPPEAARRLRRQGGQSVVQLYGVTEAPLCLASAPEDAPVAPAAFKPLPWVEMALRSRPSAGPVTSHGRIQLEAGDELLEGELLIRGPHLAPDRAHPSDLPARDGRQDWLATGDAVQRHDGGNLRLMGRLLEAIPAATGTYFPEDLERVVRSFPEVQDVCAVGLPPQQGASSVKIFVQLLAGQKLDADQVVQACQKALPGCPPLLMVPVISLPRAEDGVVLRRVLLEREVARLFPRSSARCCLSDDASDLRSEAISMPERLQEAAPLLE